MTTCRALFASTFPSKPVTVVNFGAQLRPTLCLDVCQAEHLLYAARSFRRAPPVSFRARVAAFRSSTKEGCESG